MLTLDVSFSKRANGLCPFAKAEMFQFRNEQMDAVRLLKLLRFIFETGLKKVTLKTGSFRVTLFGGFRKTARAAAAADVLSKKCARRSSQEQFRVSALLEEEVGTMLGVRKTVRAAAATGVLTNKCARRLRQEQFREKGLMKGHPKTGPF